MSSELHMRRPQFSNLRLRRRHGGTVSLKAGDIRPVTG